MRLLLVREQALADIHLRRADRELLNDLVSVEKNDQRFLIAFGATVNRVHIGNEICGLRVQPGEFIFPRFIAAVREGSLDGIAIQLAHLRLSGPSFENLLGDGFNRSIGDTVVADACAAHGK